MSTWTSTCPPSPDERWIICDIETMGLVKEDDHIVEVGLAVTGLDLKVIDAISLTIWTPKHEERYADLIRAAGRGDEKAEFVLNMHEKNSLWRDARSGGHREYEDAEQNLVEWLEKHGVQGKDPMLGSSVGFDRDFLRFWMPQVDEMFHYRIVDVSTVKELARRYNPEAYQFVQENYYDNAVKAHRVLEDIADSASELNGYVHEFLIETI